MSNIRATTISDETGNGPIALTKQYTAKAWVHFSTLDDPPDIKSSAGVSSLTDEGVEVSVNLTNAMSNSFYVPVCTAGHSGTNPSNRSIGAGVTNASSFETEVYTTANAHTNTNCYCAVFGDLA